MAVSWKQKGSVAIVTLDNAPVNAINQSVRAGLADAVTKVNATPSITHVILTGSQRLFSAGGDAREFDGPTLEPHLPDVVMQIQQCTTPWIAAINGVALGGGLELALGCHMRIVSASSELGLPEVTLGIIPGAGGTQRLPRLIGLQNAVEVIVFNQMLTSKDALDMGLVDLIAENPLEAALAQCESYEKPQSDLYGRHPADLTDEDIAALKIRINRKLKGQTAPLKALELILATAQSDLATGLKRERDAFLALKISDQAKALRHVFFAERSTRKPKSLAQVTPQINAIGVVGGGTMGSGIAYALLNAGYAVTVFETDTGGVSRAVTNVENIIAASLKRGLITKDGADACRSRFQATTEYDLAKPLELIIEAAFESMEVKETIFSKLDAIISEKTILATNTSYLDVDAIAGVLSDPSRLIGLHFFAPAHIMKLLEIVRGGATSDKALAAGYALAAKLHKIPIVSGVCDGFIGNRILARYREAADYLLLRGATPVQIDQAMVAFGYPMGPYEAQDLSGLDIAHANRRRQDTARDPARPYNPVADQLVEARQLGRKTSHGWYSYHADGTRTENADVTKLLHDAARTAGVTQRSMVTKEIQDFVLTAMINEAGDILYEGIAQSAQDIDLVLIHGYGFPRWRGGLMHYGADTGFSVIASRVEKFAIVEPHFWKVSPYLQAP